MTLALTVSEPVAVTSGPGAVLTEFQTKLGKVPLALQPADALSLGLRLIAQACAAQTDLDTLDPASTPRREALRARIMARVEEKDCGHATSCWLWTGPTSGSKGRGAGYPRFSIAGHTCAVHLVLWTIEHGYIPGNRQLDHLCRTRLCVRPDHLDLVSAHRNMKRMHAAARAAAEITCEAAE